MLVSFVLVLRDVFLFVVIVRVLCPRYCPLVLLLSIVIARCYCYLFLLCVIVRCSRSVLLFSVRAPVRLLVIDRCPCSCSVFLFIVFLVMCYCDVSLFCVCCSCSACFVM